MIRLIIGNIFGLLCGLFCALSTFGKTNKDMMKLQCLDCTSGIISCIILKGYSGALTQSISLIRNILVYKEKVNKTIQIILITLMVVVGLLINNRGLLGLLPIIASIEYTIIITKTTSTKLINVSLAINNILWIIYDFTIQNYTNCLMSSLIILASLINIVHKNRKDIDIDKM